MCGNAQPDGRPLGGSELSPIFRHLWTKEHRIKLACSLQRHFPTNDVLLRSGDIHDQVTKLCEIAQNFDVFGLSNFGGKGHPNF